ncbi:Transaldolase 2 [Spatholobus suberectus]|nr:Transaldolase 2 [Spatholobus suberectus]
MERNSNGVKIKSTILHHLYEKQRQSPYYDNLRRPVSDLLPFIANGIRGVTTNPAIFESAISSSNAYDEQLRELAEAGKDIESVYWELVLKDIQDTCKLLEPIYNEKDGVDGYVSVAVSPKLANDTKGTTEAAKWIHKMVGRPNVYIKIPATDESILSMKEVISLGISVNATLIFCLPRYEEVIDAYLDGLEASSMTDLSKVTSAATFYISRVDTTLDKKLEQIGTTEALNLRGKAAVAQAVLAYPLYQKKFSGPRWEHLEKRGAKKQRLMWASTNVKNQAYPDTFYVDSLIGPDTTNLLMHSWTMVFFLELLMQKYQRLNTFTMQLRSWGLIGVPLDLNWNMRCWILSQKALTMCLNACKRRLSPGISSAYKPCFQVNRYKSKPKNIWHFLLYEYDTGCICSMRLMPSNL